METTEKQWKPLKSNGESLKTIEQIERQWKTMETIQKQWNH